MGYNINKLTSRIEINTSYHLQPSLYHTYITIAELSSASSWACTSPTHHHKITFDMRVSYIIIYRVKRPHCKCTAKLLPIQFSLSMRIALRGSRYARWYPSRMRREREMRGDAQHAWFPRTINSRTRHARRVIAFRAHETAYTKNDLHELVAVYDS